MQIVAEAFTGIFQGGVLHFFTLGEEMLCKRLGLKTKDFANPGGGTEIP